MALSVCFEYQVTPMLQEARQDKAAESAHAPGAPD
jgi:hypothetical protein